ncbi:MAG: hypothetical protein ABIW76_18810 [Fibrobacteria bacterium]
MMKKIGVSLWTIGLLGTLGLAEDIKVEMYPAHYGVFNNLGVIEARGDTTSSYGTTGEPIRRQPFSRFGGWLAMGATVEDRTDISVLLAMMTWNSLPLTSGSPFSRMQSTGSNLGHAYITHKFGDMKYPWLTLKFGAFDYAYSDSKNLGGHLFTGGTYPGTLTGNFWNLIDGNDYRAQGLMGRFSFFDNTLNIDASAFFEHANEPNYDLSPGIVASYKVGEFLEVGAGAVFSHLLAWDEDAVTPKVRSNAYIGDNRLAESEWLKPGLEATDSLILADTTDPRYGTKLDPATRPDLVAKGIEVAYITRADNGIANSQLEYYTFKGTKVMGRLAIKPFSFGENLNRVSLYTEVTLLGVKNYPFFYEKQSERMPIMFGINLPLPGGYEISGEAEHYKNKFMNNVRPAYQAVLPQWKEQPGDFFVDSLDAGGRPVSNGQSGFLETSKAMVSHNNGEWFWSVTAKKTVFGKLGLSAKLAHDFLRLYNFFGNPSDQPAFQHDYGWYMVFKTEVNI